MSGLRDRIAAFTVAWKHGIDLSVATPAWLGRQAQPVRRAARSEADAILALVRAHHAEPAVVERAARAIYDERCPQVPIQSIADVEDEQTWDDLCQEEREELLSDAKAALASALEDGAC